MRALLIEEGWSRAALAAARALGRAGWTVGVGSPVPSLACRSRWVKDWHEVPLPEAGMTGFLSATARAVESGRYSVVFGVGDAEVLALSLGRDELDAVVPYAPHDTVLQAFDKLTLARIAESIGLATPRTYSATDDAVARLKGAAIMKARHHWVPGSQAAPPRQRTRVVFGPAGAKRRADEVRSLGGEPILQELIQGDLIAVAALCDREAEVVAMIQQRAERMWPPQIGISTRARSQPLDQELAAGVSRLLRELGWFGLAEIQFLVPADGRPRVIDFNGRPYGSMSLALAAGTNLQAMWASMALGLPAGPVKEARPGVRYHWLEGDLRRCRVEGRPGGMWKDLFQSLAWAPGAVHSIWDPRDPLPGFRHATRLAGGGWRKLFERGVVAQPQTKDRTAA